MTVAAAVRVIGIVLAAAVLGADCVAAQAVTQRGFVEPRVYFFPEDAPNDRTTVVGDLLAREEVFAKPAVWLQVAGGIDVRANSHDQVETAFDISDRGLKRPLLSVRRLTATLARAWLTVDVGKQFIRWGKTDIVNPTDLFAPRDFLDVVDNEFLGVTAARVVAQAGADSVEVIVARFTPSRLPLLTQRWTVIPPQAGAIPVIDATRDVPGRGQYGIRWNHAGTAVEYSASVFDGFNHQPTVATAFDPGIRGSTVPIAAIFVDRVYPAIRSYGADAALPTRWLTLKAEAAYVTTSTAGADEYILYVVQAERQTGEWLVVGGYIGEVVTERRAPLTFAPDRGLARSIVGRATYTIDPNRSLAVETAVRQNGAGVWAKTEYSQARGNHWRVTATATIIAGHSDDFLGQYHRNSHVLLTARYSF